MDLGIAGKTALVMSAGGGLGGAIAMALAREGAQVAVSDRSHAALERTVNQIRDAGGNVRGYVADLAQLDSLDSMLEAIRRDLGDIDILINNSGGPAPSPAAGVDSQTWRTQFDSMVLSLMHLTDRVLPSMRAKGWGRIVTSTSSGVVAPIANLGVSNTLRAALLGWSKTLANEVARDGVCVNVVLPGRIGTERIRSLDELRAQREGRSVDSVVAQSVATIPVGRYGSPEEYGDVVAFLASARASFITGSVIRVDGGMIQSI
ncbi:SDR family oxidoreductase [Pararobbsia silviterrae]|uniref:SDR family oxidoreductase n=1 Tax=Pararobbsia silviterrae TaxID=1792498 RepID=A0A494XRL5_9BURK|nr:SDR family oxidoreductase [Pararobbsia silviterrae]RKP53270.1 SDR family oxidoreductase [Pararobbsia silviterrae]